MKNDKVKEILRRFDCVFRNNGELLLSYDEVNELKTDLNFFIQNHENELKIVKGLKYWDNWCELQIMHFLNFLSNCSSSQLEDYTEKVNSLRGKFDQKIEYVSGINKIKEFSSHERVERI